MSIPIKDIKILWARAAGRCSLAGCRRELSQVDNDPSISLWQVIAFREAARLNINDNRLPKRHSAAVWDKAYELKAWLLRQKPPPVQIHQTKWDLAFSSIQRDVFRTRRTDWHACVKRETENLGKTFARSKESSPA